MSQDKISSSRQTVEPRKGRDAPAGKVSRGERSSRAATSKKHSYVTLPFGVRVVRRSWYLGLVTVAAVAVLLSVLLLYAFREFASEASGRSASLSELRGIAALQDSEIVAAVSDDGGASADVQPLSLRSILETYRTASGMTEVRGVILHGNYVEDGRAFTMKLLTKAPSLVRKTLKDDALTLVCSYDGETAAVEIEHPEGKMHRQVLTDVLYQKAILLEGAVMALGPNELPDVLVYQWQADQVYEGQACWTIRRRMSAQESMIHLLDSETGLERVRYVTFMHEGERQQLSLHLSDYRRQGEGMLPFGYTLKFNGKLRGEAQLDSIQLNPGLMPWMF